MRKYAAPPLLAFVVVNAETAVKMAVLPKVVLTLVLLHLAVGFNPVDLENSGKVTYKVIPICSVRVRVWTTFICMYCHVLPLCRVLQARIRGLEAAGRYLCAART